jgi:hypothetical protein
MPQRETLEMNGFKILENMSDRNRSWSEVSGNYHHLLAMRPELGVAAKLALQGTVASTLAGPFDQRPKIRGRADLDNLEHDMTEEAETEVIAYGLCTTLLDFYEALMEAKIYPVKDRHAEITTGSTGVTLTRVDIDGKPRSDSRELEKDEPIEGRVLELIGIPGHVANATLKIGFHRQLVSGLIDVNSHEQRVDLKII